MNTLSTRGRAKSPAHHRGQLLRSEARRDARVVFFLQGERVPAARARVLAIVPALERAGLRCEVRVPYPSVYGDTRLPWPLNRLRPLYVPWSFMSRWGAIGGMHEEDVVFFQRPMTELPTILLEKAVGRGHRTVFDFDDAIFMSWSARQKFPTLIELADHVIAGNGYLAAAAAAPNKTTVIPTVVDTDRFREMPMGDEIGKGVVVGWTGSAVGYRYLAAAAPGIARALQETGARFRVISDRPPPRELAPLRPEFVPWRPESEIADLATIDIGIMPLPDGPQERGKCAYKLIQYMAIGRPAVASPVGANLEVATEGVDGFFADDASAWRDKLVQLIREPHLRRQVAVRARQRIVEAYSVSAVVPRYLRVLTDLGAKVTAPHP